MENKENQSESLQMTRVLGLKESISMTVGTVVGVGLFTSGSAQIGHVGPGFNLASINIRRDVRIFAFSGWDV